MRSVKVTNAQRKNSILNDGDNGCKATDAAVTTTHRRHLSRHAGHARAVVCAESMPPKTVSHDRLQVARLQQLLSIYTCCAYVIDDDDDECNHNNNNNELMLASRLRCGCRRCQHCRLLRLGFTSHQVDLARGSAATGEVKTIEATASGVLRD
jgi:hypothetical protein